MFFFDKLGLSSFLSSVFNFLIIPFKYITLPYKSIFDGAYISFYNPFSMEFVTLDMIGFNDSNGLFSQVLEAIIRGPLDFIVDLIGLSYDTPLYVVILTFVGSFIVVLIVISLLVRIIRG